MSNNALKWDFIYDKFPGLVTLLDKEITDKIFNGVSELGVKDGLSPYELAALVHDGVCDVLYDYWNRRESGVPIMEVYR